jgi:hypothetical protein
MNCVLCGMTSIDVKIEQFPLSPEARKMLRRKFRINPDEALAENEICRECLALPFDERNKLAEKAIKSAPDENRRAAIQSVLKKTGN